jgi:zinc protease
MQTLRSHPRVAALALAVTLSLGLAGPAATVAEAKPAASKNVHIPYEQFTLPNGLRVIVHTDRKAPVVAVNIWYHVGSKDEPTGRTGFAHLFEHLMFQGSENYKGEFFEPFELVGVTDQNGTTNSDRTNYFQNVPTTALDMALFMESDRMGHFLGAVDQALLDEQRGVVQNEKRQGENQPYGQMFNRILKSSYPKGHPYHHSVIGSMNDLNAASLEDVKNWFRSYYGPNNAVLVLAGDIDLKTAKEKASKFFGHIPATASPAKINPNLALRTQSTRDNMTDQVPQTRIMRVWNIPQVGTVESDQASLLAQVLGGSRSSRLDKRLVFEDKLVDSVSASAWGSELGGLFFIQADVKQGVDPAKVEAAMKEELDKLIAQGPTAAEVEQARTVFKAGFIRGIERIGGFGGKADVLAECAVFLKNPACYRDSLKALDDATPASLQAIAKKYLSQGDHTLTIAPGERVATVEEPAGTPPKSTVPAADKKFKTTAAGYDRSAGVPKTESFPNLVFPALQRATLSNGLKVVVAERRGLPVVQMNMIFDGGFTSDKDRLQGTASFTMGMLDEGAGNYDALTLGDRIEALGANLGTGASLDTSSAFLSALSEKLDDSLAVYADVIQRPRFDDKEVERVRAQWLATIKQEKARPNSIQRRLINPILFGNAHPYGIPASGTGNEADIAKISKADMQAWHSANIRPDNATLVVVGDTDLNSIVPKLEKHFGGWKADGAKANTAQITAVNLPSKPRIFLVDQKGAIQANIMAAQLVPSSNDGSAVEFEVANGVLGGEFSSRLNMNLRENKRWSYGSYSGVGAAKGQRVWAASAGVQIDKTIESLKEMQREISEYASGKAPASPAEVSKIQNSEVRALPGSFETAAAVLGTVNGIVTYNRPDNWAQVRADRISALTPEKVNANAMTINPNALTWIVVGDLSKIEAGIRGLNLGEVTVLDANGNPVAAAPAMADKAKMKK